MDFLRILRSLEEFLYEVMTWLLYYPRTFWQVLRHPIKMLDYSEHELKDAPEDRYSDSLSPPLFLMITILLSHAIELASHQRLPKPESAIAQEIMSSEQNLLILRSILFAIYPLMFTIAMLRHQGRPLDRKTLRAPFFSQCYLAAPAALSFGIASIFLRQPHALLQLASAAIVVCTMIWYIAIEAHWFREQAHTSRALSTWIATRTWFKATIINAVISFAVLGSVS